MTLVVDASVACKWLVEEDGSEAAAAVLDGGESLVAPDLIVAEVCNALWRKLRAGEIAPAQAEAGVESLAGIFDDLVASGRLAVRAFAIAEALRHPVYDCFYLALAEQGDTRLVTADAVLLGRLSGTAWAQRATGLGDLDGGD